MSKRRVYCALWLLTWKGNAQGGKWWLLFPLQTFEMEKKPSSFSSTARCVLVTSIVLPAKCTTPILPVRVSLPHSQSRPLTKRPSGPPVTELSYCNSEVQVWSSTVTRSRVGRRSQAHSSLLHTVAQGFGLFLPCYGLTVVLYSPKHDIQLVSF